MRNALARAVTIGVSAGTVAAGATVAGAGPAYAAAEWVEVKPSTVQAGFSTTVRASCGDNLNPARVTSEAFADELALPQNGLLVATVTVPPDRKPNSYLVRVTCPNGRAATTKVHVLAMPAPARGPDTGGGALASESGDARPSMLVLGLATLATGGVLGLVRRARRRTSANA